MSLICVELHSFSIVAIDDQAADTFQLEDEEIHGAHRQRINRGHHCGIDHSVPHAVSGPFDIIQYVLYEAGDDHALE